MDLFISFCRKYWFGISIFLIIVLAGILRFYNYENRWGLAYDQARDVIVAREALKLFQLPLIGPFSSAGEFVYGPQWFWILMVFVGIYPFSVITPWIIQTLLYVGVVGLAIIIGKDIHSKKLGLILGFLTAISTSQVSHATNLTSPSMVGIFAFVAIYFFVRYIKTGFIKNAFWMAFIVGTSINIHFQSIGLLVLVPISFILDKNKNLKKLFYLVGGTIVPFIPLIFFDITNNFFESRNWIEYILHGQYAIYIPNRWLTYVGVYWPSSWIKVIGGIEFLGYVVPILFSIFIAINIFRKNLSRVMFGLIFSFFSIFLMLRYYRGERIDSNLIFLHPFILIFTGWVILKTLKLNHFAGLALALVIIIFTLKMDLIQIKNADNFAAILAQEWREDLIKTFPNKKFSVYDYQYKHVHKSLPLVLFLEDKNKIDDEGLRIGLYIATTKTNFSYPAIIGTRGGYQILNFGQTSVSDLSKEEWANVNTRQIHKSTVEWYKKNNL